MQSDEDLKKQVTTSSTADDVALIGQRLGYDFSGDDLLRFNGQKVDKGDSFASKAHRSWMDIKNFFSADNEEAMLEEAIKGEKAAVNTYEEVLEETNLPPSTETLLTQQKNQIVSGLNNIKRLEDIA